MGMAYSCSKLLSSILAQMVKLGDAIIIVDPDDEYDKKEI